MLHIEWAIEAWKSEKEMKRLVITHSNLVCRDHPAGLAPLGMVPPHSVDPSTLGRNIPIRTRFAQVLPQYRVGMQDVTQEMG